MKENLEEFCKELLIKQYNIEFNREISLKALIEKKLGDKAKFGILYRNSFNKRIKNVGDAMNTPIEEFDNITVMPVSGDIKFESYIGRVLCLTGYKELKNGRFSKKLSVLARVEI